MFFNALFKFQIRHYAFYFPNNLIFNQHFTTHEQDGSKRLKEKSNPDGFPVFSLLLVY
jgi:hypothetical protein